MTTTERAHCAAADALVCPYHAEAAIAEAIRESVNAKLEKAAQLCEACADLGGDDCEQCHRHDADLIRTLMEPA